MRRRRITTLEIEPDAWLELTAVADAAAPLETGGILLGYRTRHAVVVAGVAEVADYTATTTSYTMRTAQAQAVLDDVRQFFPVGSAVGYIGDWHSHPANSPPSTTDRRSHATLNRHYRKAMAGLVAVHTCDGWVPHAHLANRWRLARCTVEIKRQDTGP